MSLLAVITAFPLLRSAFMYSFPGSIPPSTSITKSIESSFKISSKLSVTISVLKVLSLDISETKTLLRSISTISLSRFSRRLITAEPILPAPKTATEYDLFFIISKDKC